MNKIFILLLISILFFSFSKPIEAKNEKKIRKNSSRTCDMTNSKDLDDYLDQVQRHLKKQYGNLIQDYFHQHRGVIALHQETQLEIKVKIDPSGQVLSQKITKSSEEKLLDQLVINLIAQKSPLPRPEKICEDILDQGILIKFIVNNTTFK